MKKRDPGLKAVLKVMRASTLAPLINRTVSAVCNWEKVPIELVPAVAKATGLHPLVIRPDYVGPLLELCADPEAA